MRFEALDVFGAKQVVGQVILSTGSSSARRRTISDAIFSVTRTRAFSTQIAYVSYERLDNGERYRLWWQTPTARMPRSSQATEPILSPAWSPSSSTAYATEIMRPSSMGRARYRGTARCPHAGVNSAPAWSPDGQKLAVAPDRRQRRDLRAQSRYAGAEGATDELAIDTEPTWARDGRTLYFTSDRSGGPQIYKAYAPAAIRSV